MTKDDLERVFDRISTRLNNVLCEMKPNYDDSIVGFNEAWDVVRAVFKDEIAKVRPKPGAITHDDIDAIISDNVYVDNDGVAGISSAAEAIIAAIGKPSFCQGADAVCHHPACVCVVPDSTLEG